ncbi:MFS transporter [Aristophania vespae]|uniref:MFS transporter n=1 Tax=Aristophania vespae TaxID=2697033 RepID=A0A6P1NDV7_9PROT|nr:oligopeptide:H+ symporter [Aristophania vespae]QHI95107.1 MFS transporter [Aristophania vespae]
MFPASSSHSSSSLQRGKAFSVVLAIEIWERFGYYGMQAVLTVFMVQNLHMLDKDVNLMLGAFAVLAYSLPIVGGIIGDYYLGTRPTLVIGACGLTLGYALLAISLQQRAFFLPALALIALSNGLFKPNAGNLVRRVYSGDDTALDAAFTLYYMSINVGSVISMILLPWVQSHWGPAIAFGGCASGLLVGLSYYIWRASWLNPFAPAQLLQKKSKFLFFCLFIFLLVALWSLSVLVLAKPSIAQLGVIAAGVALAILSVYLLRCVKSFEKPGLILTYILCLQTVAYQIFFQQMQTSLTLFALRAVSGQFKIGSIYLFTLSAGQFYALNPFWIMVFSPIAAYFYHRWAKNDKDIALFYKILAGYVMVGAGFLLWWLSAKHATGLVSPWVMVAGYGCVSFGEILTVGLGLSIIARYAPVRMSAILMGALYMLWGIGMYVGSLVANGAAIASVPHQQVVAGLYAPLFGHLVLGAVILCAVIVLLLPFMRILDKKHNELRPRTEKTA